MNEPATSPGTPAALFGWMEGLADATRLRLLRVLERQELGVVELCQVLKLPQSTVSRHLKVLADQGWLENRRHGTSSLYRMSASIDPTARRLWRLALEQTEGWATLRQDELRLESRLRARREETQSFFSGAAADWDRMRTELYGDRFDREAILGLLPADWTVADLGCGTGELTASLALNVRRVIGVDQSAAMLRAARRRTEGFSNVELHRSALERLPVEDGTCDAALLVLVLTYVAEVPAVLLEAARILKPGGQLALLDLVRHDDEELCRRMGQACLGFEPAALGVRLADAGLTPSGIRPLPPAPGAGGPLLFFARAEKPRTNSATP